MSGVEDTKFFLTGDWGHITPQLNIEHLEEVVLKNIDIPQFYSFPALSFLTPLLNVLHRVSVINSRVHTTPCETSAELSELEYIDVSSNLLNDWTLREMMCNGRGVLQGLRTVNVSRNNLKSLNSQLFTQLDKLETLDMSGNQFHSMPEICNWPSSLRILNLSSSHLTKATDCLPKSLYTLDLSHNDLTKFTIELPVLTELYISGNKISSLSNGNLFPALVFLLIQNNALQTFSDNDLKLYKKLKTLEAGARTFVCSCDFVAFVTSDMPRHRVTLRDGFESYVCESPDAARGERVEDAGLSVFECHTALALSILCSSILIVLLLIAGLCYKFSAVWYLKMTWAWLRAKRRRPVLKKGELRYDAFVSYSERDSGWVDEHLVPELELSEPPLHLCLHKRDFLPGARILDNIMEAIEQSHRTLFVLSRHFVNSEWCKYELDYSHFRLFDQNNDTAVLILLEPIAKETIPKRFCKLRKFMNSRTYLEWPDDDSKIPRFWQSLREAIKTP
ncbi:toll-like receptor 2 [Polymixia lowei]